MKELGKIIQIPSQSQLQIHQYIQTLIPEPPHFIEKYEEAVSTLARVDPIRAFRLRGQPAITTVLTTLRGLAASTESNAEIWRTIFEPEFLERFKPHLDELILDVARGHSWITWWRARRRLNKKVTLSKDDTKWITDIIDKLKKADSDGQQP
jgi:hypothetical protein